MSSTDERFRGVVKGAFELRERGTVLSIEIAEGKVATRDHVLVALANGETRLVEVKAIGFIDHEVGLPTFHANVTLLVVGIAAAEVSVGADICAP